MKAVISRCTSASVTVAGERISSIGRGLLVLVGIGTTDTTQDLQWLVGKILGLKVFPTAGEEEGAGGGGWKRSVMDVEGSVLCVSQFTLMADVKKNKPDFRKAMTAEQSRAMYDDFLAEMRMQYVPDRIQDGKFGAMMDVGLTNDGPVTILLDSSERRGSNTPGTQTPPQQSTINDKKQRRKEDFEAKTRANAEKAKAANVEAEKSLTNNIQDKVVIEP
ncbi:hypothetical protein T439DRAFT_2716 [Meredithblackwellia eburnea MCA 4105]